jgi:CTP synthase (UTP-ammonia lyase)
MRVAARGDEGGSIRAVELTTHPFFIGTLFQPERAALRDLVPPLVKAFVAAVQSREIAHV